MSTTRTTIAGLVAALLLAGCADHPAKSGAPVQPSARSVSRSPSAPPSNSPNRERSESTAAAGTSVENSPASGEAIGIQACDDYLASYRACHRAAAIYAPDQIEHHYEMMHESLLRDSRNPEIRPQLAARCNSLAGTLRQALHGKACASEPAPAASSAP